MFYEIIDAEWFQVEGVEADIETVSAHYEKLNINTAFYVEFFKLCKIEFKSIFAINCDEKSYLIGIYQSNETVCLIHGNYTRLFYFDHAGEFLLNSKLLFGLNINEYPKLIGLADSIYYDQYLMAKFIYKK